VASRSANYGIFTSGSGGIYSGDHEVSNGNDGVILISSHAITITGNTANGNGANGGQGNGIDDFGFSTTLTKNTADFNGQDGIYVTDTSTLDGGGNTAKGNDYIAGNPPEQCRGVVCG
jgi:parallel beta-helix repeat protein